MLKKEKGVREIVAVGEAKESCRQQDVVFKAEAIKKYIFIF
jgi:hypothetical protein